MFSTFVVGLPLLGRYARELLNGLLPVLRGVARLCTAAPAVAQSELSLGRGLASGSELRLSQRVVQSAHPYHRPSAGGSAADPTIPFVTERVTFPGAKACPPPLLPLPLPCGLHLTLNNIICTASA